MQQSGLVALRRRYERLDVDMRGGEGGARCFGLDYTKSAHAGLLSSTTRDKNTRLTERLACAGQGQTDVVYYLAQSKQSALSWPVDLLE
jgi:hypothetical protein